MKYRIALTATAAVRAVATVEAESEEQARRIAREQAESGNVIWHYEGTDDGSIEVQVATHAS